MVIQNSKTKASKTKASKIYGFIDASNIIYGCTRAGWKMDFEKLAKYLKTRYKVQRLLYYGGLDSDNKKQLGFYEVLQRLGYETRLVPVKRFSDGKRKGDVDSRLTFEAMQLSSDYTGAIFLTGDGDYFWLLEYLLKIRKEIRLMAHSHSQRFEAVIWPFIYTIGEYSAHSGA